MHAKPISATGRALLPLLGRRLAWTLGFATLFGLFINLLSVTPAVIVIGRAWLVGVVAFAAFSTLEFFPRRLPSWMARWVLQLIGVVLAVPLGSLTAYYLFAGASFAFFHNQDMRGGFGVLTLIGLLFGPWIALGAIVRQREAVVRSQSLAFDLERGELERQATDARMRLLQAQIQPHFLFNTLANVQALVDTGSPIASKVLGSLIAYLRAAVPALDQPFTTVKEELSLVRSYLDLMHMRMPDRLAFAIHASDDTLALRCPPLTLMTLVENAVRHGIDPSEEGGRIDLHVQLWDQRCRILVSDTGVGLQQTGTSLGTGLASLRERLALSFGDGTLLHVADVMPHGVSVELLFPARRSPA